MTTTVSKARVHKHMRRALTSSGKCHEYHSLTRMTNVFTSLSRVSNSAIACRSMYKAHEQVATTARVFCAASNICEPKQLLEPGMGQVGTSCHIANPQAPEVSTAEHSRQSSCFINTQAKKQSRKAFRHSPLDVKAMRT